MLLKIYFLQITLKRITHWLCGKNKYKFHVFDYTALSCNEFFIEDVEGRGLLQFSKFHSPYYDVKGSLAVLILR